MKADPFVLVLQFADADTLASGTLLTPFPRGTPRETLDAGVALIVAELSRMTAVELRPENPEIPIRVLHFWDAGTPVPLRRRLTAAQVRQRQGTHETADVQFATRDDGKVMVELNWR
jgi:hypothetical protein